MARSQRHRNWVAKLAPVQGRPQAASIKPEWTTVLQNTTETVDMKREPEVVQRRRGQGVVRIGNVRVSFPIRFGIGLGMGGVDSGGLVLRLARVEGGCGVPNDHDCGNIVRYYLHVGT